MITVKNLSKRFTRKKVSLTVFENISFEIAEGETVCFLGPSGCGKSTLLRCVAGLLQYDGEIKIKGESPAMLARRKELGFAFQDAGLIEWRTVAENIMLPAEIGVKQLPEQEKNARVKELMSIVGLEKFSEYLPNELSGGMKQRVALARALMLKPKLLLMDEPFSALDNLTRSKLTVFFEKILKQQKITTILITHDIQEAVYLSDRIFIMSKIPSKFTAEVEVRYTKERTHNLFDDPEFGKLVSECRKFLFQNELDV